LIKRKAYRTNITMVAEGSADAAKARKRRKAIRSQRQDEGDIPAEGNGITYDPEEMAESGKANAEKKKDKATAAAAATPKQKRKPRQPPPPPQQDDDDADEDDDATTSTSNSASNSKKRKKGGSSNKKKTQIRYDPDIPMNKEQLAAWRREARRVRNRESAAASRQRIRNRITELEEELDSWRSKYNQAIERLEHLEQVQRSQRSGITGQESNEALAAAAAAAAGSTAPTKL